VPTSRKGTSRVTPRADRSEGMLQQAKKLLADPRDRIRFHDLMMAEAQRVSRAIGDEHFPLDGVPLNAEALAARLSKYEAVTGNLRVSGALAALWGDAGALRTLASAQACLDRPLPNDGQGLWRALRWYPLALVVYAHGIAAVAGARHGFAYSTLRRMVVGFRSYVPVARRIAETIFSSDGGFHALPDAGQTRYPGSEHLFQVLQPELNQVVLLEPSCEDLFDAFEVLIGLVCADEADGTPRGSWLPTGRALRNKARVFGEMQRQAAADRERWQPLVDGLFAGSYERFEKAANQLGEEFERLAW
jgi:hypothetical protein